MIKRGSKVKYNNTTYIVERHEENSYLVKVEGSNSFISIPDKGVIELKENRFILGGNRINGSMKAKGKTLVERGIKSKSKKLNG